MNRDGFWLWRVVHPTTILFFLFILFYGLAVENGILEPVEAFVRGLPVPRWLVTLLFYIALMGGVAVLSRLLARGNRAAWIEAISSNRGGLWIFDGLLLVGALFLTYLGWRYYGIFYLDLLPIVLVTVFTALVGLFRSPPWRHIIVFQRDNNALLVPSMLTINQELGQGDAAIWDYAERRLQEANPGFNMAVQSAGQELYVPADVRPPPPDPAVPPAAPAPPPPATP